MENNNIKFAEEIDTVITKSQCSRTTIQNGEIFLRFMSFVVTILSALLVGFDRQTRTFLLEAGADLPPLKLEITAKYQYLSTMVFFVTANAIVCTYSAISLAFYLMSIKDIKKQSFSHVLIVTDALVMGFLLSADGAAASVGLIGKNGNTHLQWHKVCYMFNKFCNQGSAAIVLSVVGSVCLFILVAASSFNMYKRVNQSHVAAG